jgi:hypothetical protein
MNCDATMSDFNDIAIQIDSALLTRNYIIWMKDPDVIYQGDDALMDDAIRLAEKFNQKLNDETKEGGQ